MSGTRTTGRRLACGLAAAALLAGLAAPASRAQQPPAPTRYSITEVLSLAVEGQTVQIARDGQKAIVEQEVPPHGTDPRGSHSRAYFDLAAGKSYTLDLIDPTTPCGPSSLSGDWGDPFEMSADLTAQMAKYRAIETDDDSINGIAAKIRVAATPEGLVRLWIEPNTGLILKWEIDPPTGPPKIMILVSAYTVTPPPPEAFTPPAKCAG